MGAVRGDLIADYLRLYGGRGESRAEARSRAPERFVTNPSLHAVAMIRAALDGPAAAFGLWRQLLLAKHSIDLERGCSIGPGLVLPHPFGLLLTTGAEIGADVILYHNVTIGEAGSEGPAPVIGDGAIIHTNAVIVNGAVIGSGAVVGVNSVVEDEVPAGAVVKRGRIEPRRK
jgi:serine acetyltransferase